MNINLDGNRQYKLFHQFSKDAQTKDNLEGVDTDPRDGVVRFEELDMEFFYQSDHPKSELGESLTSIIDDGPFQIVETTAEFVSRAAATSRPQGDGEVSNAILASPGDLYFETDITGEKVGYHIDKGTKTVTCLADQRAGSER